MPAPRTAGPCLAVAALSFLVLVRPAFPQNCERPFLAGSSFVPLAGGFDPREIAVADFNHDGFLDLAVQELAPDTVTIMKGSAGGLSLLTTLPPFASSADVLSGVGPASFDVANSLVYVGSEEGVIYAVGYPFP